MVICATVYFETWSVCSTMNMNEMYVCNFSYKILCTVI